MDTVKTVALGIVLVVGGCAGIVVAVAAADEAVVANAAELLPQHMRRNFFSVGA